MDRITGSREECAKDTKGSEKKEDGMEGERTGEHGVEMEDEEWGGGE